MFFFALWSEFFFLFPELSSCFHWCKNSWLFLRLYCTTRSYVLSHVILEWPCQKIYHFNYGSYFLSSATCVCKGLSSVQYTEFYLLVFLVLLVLPTGITGSSCTENMRAMFSHCVCKTQNICKENCMHPAWTYWLCLLHDNITNTNKFTEQKKSVRACQCILALQSWPLQIRIVITIVYASEYWQTTIIHSNCALHA